MALQGRDALVLLRCRCFGPPGPLSLNRSLLGRWALAGPGGGCFHLAKRLAVRQVSASAARAGSGPHAGALTGHGSMVVQAAGRASERQALDRLPGRFSSRYGGGPRPIGGPDRGFQLGLVGPRFKAGSRRSACPASCSCCPRSPISTWAGPGSLQRRGLLGRRWLRSRFPCRFSRR